MSTRHRARAWAVQFLFQRDFNPGDLEEALTDFWAARNTEQETRAFTERLVRGVEGALDELDRKLQSYAEHWDVQRMNAVERNVLRVALYEILHCEDIPSVVSINEAIELAKDFSDERAGRFVNGILDRAARERAGAGEA